LFRLVHFKTSTIQMHQKLELAGAVNWFTASAFFAAREILGLIFVKTQIGANAQRTWLCVTERHSACVYKFWLF